VCLIFASFLIKFWFLKPLGGLYLLYLVYDHYQAGPKNGSDEIVKEKSWIYKRTLGLLGKFWATVTLIELMDLAFSIDNVFAVVAFTENIILVVVGRVHWHSGHAAGGPGLCAVDGPLPVPGNGGFRRHYLLGVKLLLSLFEHYQPQHPLSVFLGSETADVGLTVLTVAMFLVPWATSVLFNYPRRMSGGR
jgi:hypothetical protein